MVFWRTVERCESRRLLELVDKLQDAASSLGVRLDERQCGQYLRYCELIEESSCRFNLTGVKGQDRICEELFIRSLRLLAPAPGGYVSTAGWFDDRRVLDVGAGAGIPGIVLKIACPNMELAMLESSAKKCDFLKRAIDDLSLQRVEVINARAEEAAHEPRFREQFDLVVSRGVAKLPELVELTLPFASVGGTVISAKGLSAEPEVTGSAWAASELGALPAISREADSPGSAPPDLLIYWLKIASTPARYPRRVGVPRARPLIEPGVAGRA